MKKALQFTIIFTLSLLLLVACNNPNDAQNDLNNNNTAFDDRDTGITRVGYNNAQGGHEGQHAEIQEMNHGYLTIDQNSFSTTIPSEKFPHFENFAHKGPFDIYKFQQEVPQGQQPGGGQEAAPENQPQQEQAEGDTNKQAQESTEGISETEMKVIELTNAERRKNGLSDLKADASLSNVARDKSKDMQQNNYFSHTSPNHGSPFDMMRDYGISYRTAGENIAMGQRSPEEVVQAWMNSEGHRKNILNGQFTHIGVGYVEEGNYWTQMFIGK
ncbi:Cysteine-rich secretory protein family protein [Bacillus sp. THAF10]|uniref:CAP domain-containing protein n=1 Tax=Bacillus sp. THAF10 TaxID=2587848 RepID=UPI001267FF15|nr:CAP domain-containing protein [Bacillus sp. THAF10]QFT89152.1 Cysteine-rich secretory protein family protein [Bacillus sp. THAF10]